MTAVRKQKKDATYEWFTQADLRRYRGKYVAIVGRQVAASGKDARRVLAQARKRFPGREVVLWKEPLEDILIF